MKIFLLCIWGYFLFLPVSSSCAQTVKENVFLIPPPPFISLVNYQKRKEQDLAKAESPFPIKVIARSLAPAVKLWGLLAAHNFLNVLQYDITYYYNPLLQFHAGVFTFLKNTSDDSATPYRGMWNNMTALSDIELGVRTSFYELFFLGLGFGQGVYVELRSRELRRLIFDRIFLYTEMGVMKQFSPFSFLVGSVQFRVGTQMRETPIVLFNRSRLWNIELLLGWKWEY